MARNVVGIDLGTTNSALAHASLPEGDKGSGGVRVDTVAQLVAPGSVLPRPTLPSFLYLAGAHELAAGATRLPWSESDTPVIAGELARIQGAQVPARLVSSAKSWLCHPRVDRLAAILPWGADGDGKGADELTKISPVAASAHYLRHLAGAWHSAHGTQLADEELIVGVPASFDEVARELTLRAAQEVGLQPTLLEEPQAAFYAWLADHPESELVDGDTVLVFDVGGGTTDFSLIRVEGAGESRRYVRTAVGDHLLLGGDNMDLTLARRVEARLARGGRLDTHSFSALVQACRTAKERLLGGESPGASWTVSIAGRGSKLIGGALRDELLQSEVEELVLDGFFPRVGLDAAPQKNIRSAIQEFGLPYAADPAITRHAAQFLTAHNMRPTAVLWNGGVLKSPAIKQRVLDVLGGWLGHAPRVLQNSDPDLAVARGAAYYGLTRHGLGRRIGGGAARAYYLGIDTQRVRPGEVTALCVLPRGMEEGSTVELKAHALEVVTNRPVRFALYSSSNAAQETDRAGDLYTGPADALTELPPLYTVLRFLRAQPETALAVYLVARLTELGALELDAVARATGNERDRWRLAFDLRAADESTGEAPGEKPVTTSDETGVDAAALDRAVQLLQSTWAKEGTSDPQTIMKSLSAILGPRDRWPVPVLRALWEPLHALRGGRGKSAQHEARWLNLVGYALRPGFGYPLDDWRCRETWRLFNAGVVHDKDDPCRLEWWILWRRISGGLTKTQQDELWKRVAPHLLPSFAKKPDRKPVGPQESAEMWRTLAAMERLTGRQKIELGDVLMAQLENRRSEKKVLDLAPWALGRLGARVPLYGPVEDLAPAKKVERWIERLLAIADREDAPGEALALAVAEMARASGDRVRDLDEPTRQRLAHWLRQRETSGRLARVVLEPTARLQTEQKLAFGDALPSGLRLAT